MCVSAGAREREEAGESITDVNSPPPGDGKPFTTGRKSCQIFKEIILKTSRYQGKKHLVLCNYLEKSPTTCVCVSGLLLPRLKRNKTRLNKRPGTCGCVDYRACSPDVVDLKLVKIVTIVEKAKPFDTASRHGTHSNFYPLTKKDFLSALYKTLASACFFFMIRYYSIEKSRCPVYLTATRTLESSAIIVLLLDDQTTT